MAGKTVKMESECVALKDLTCPGLSKSATDGDEVKNGHKENVFHPPVERRKVLLKSDSVASVPIGRRPQSAERLHATPTKQADQVAAEPWSPTTNLKVLIQAAGPDMRDREMRKVLFRPIENKYEGVALDDPSQFEVPGESNDDVEKRPCRKRKSLGLLCQKFLAMYSDYPASSEATSIPLDEVAVSLGAERRRLYDIVNVLESLKLVSRVAKNQYLWHGRQRLRETLSELRGSGWRQCCPLQEEDCQRMQTGEAAVQEGYVEAGFGAAGGRKDKSLRFLSQKFVTLFLVSEMRTVTLDLAARVLIDESQDTDSRSKYKITQLNQETIRENTMDVVVEYKRYNVTNVHVDHCKELREELEDKINEVHDQSRVNSLLAIRIAELQSALRHRNQDATFQVSVLQQQLQETIKKLDTKMANIHKKDVTIIEVHNFAVFLQQWVINQTTVQITLLQNEQEQMISKLDENADDTSKLILQILALKTRLAQIQSETSLEISDLLQELKTKFEQLETKCSELELNHTLYLQMVNLQSKVWDFETKSPNEEISRTLSDTLNQLEDKMHRLNDDSDHDTNLVLKIYFLQSVVRELQRQSLNQSEPGEDAGLETKLIDKKKELEEALMQLRRRDGRNSEMLVKIVGLQKTISDLQLESQNTNATAHIAGLQKQLNVMSERNVQLQTKYNGLLRELKEKGDLLAKSYSKNSQLASRVTELEIQLESTSHQQSAQITMLQNKLEDSIGYLNEKANDNSKLILQILTLQTEVKELQQGSSSQIADLQLQLQEKTRKLQKTSEQLNINMDLNSKLVLQILELQGIIWDLERGVNITTDPSQIPNLLHLLESKINQLENTTTDESKTVLKIFTLQSIIRELRREASNVTVPDHVIEIQMKLEQKTKDLEGVLAQLKSKKDENSQLLAKIVQLQDKVSEVKASNQTASILISGMTKKLRDAEEKYGRLQRNYSDLQTQFRAKEDAYEQLKRRHAELLKKLNRATEIDSKLQRQLDDKDEEYSILQMKYDELRKQLKEKNENCSRLQSEYNELKDHLEARKVEELRLQDNYLDLKKQFTEKETQYSRLKSKYEDLQKELREKTADFNHLQKKFNDVQKEVDEENDFKIKTDDFSLDPSTAHPKLILSSDDRVVVVGSVRQNIPDGAQRFDVVMAVLGREGFASGRRYWEVSVGQRNCYGVGVASGSAQRRGRISFNPRNGYWGIMKNRRDQVFAMATPHVPLNLRTQLHSVGVLLDYEEGQISFYNPNTRSHIYTFSHNAFEGKLFPFILSCEDTAKDDGPIIISPAPEDVSWLEKLGGKSSKSPP